MTSESSEDLLFDDAEQLKDLDLPEDEKLAKVSKLANEILDLENDIESMTEQLENLQKEHRRLTEQEMPDLLQQLGIRKFVLEDGSEVSVENKVFPGIRSDKREQCFEWLRDNGHGDLIKNTITINFGMGDLEQSNELTKQLLDSDFPYRFSEKIGVLPQTLKAFVREQEALGNELPDNLFTIHRVSVANVKTPKGRT